MPKQQLQSDVADDSGAKRISKQIEVDGLTVELEALVTGKEFGGVDERGRARWAAAGFRLTPYAATVGGAGDPQQLDLTPSSDAGRAIAAGFILVPIVSFVVMGLAAARFRRRRRTL